MLHPALTHVTVAALFVAASFCTSRAQTPTGPDPNAAFDRFCHEWGTRLKQIAEDQSIKSDDQERSRISDANRQLEQQLKIIDIPGGASNFTAVRQHLYACLDREARAAFGRGTTVTLELRPTNIRPPAQGGGTYVVSSSVIDGTINVIPGSSLAQNGPAATASQLYEQPCLTWGRTLKQIAEDAAIKSEGERASKIRAANAALQANLQKFQFTSGIDLADFNAAIASLKACIDTEAKTAFGQKTTVHFAASAVGGQRGPWKIAINGPIDVLPELSNAASRAGDFLRQPMPAAPVPTAPPAPDKSNPQQPKTITVSVCYSLKEKVCHDKDALAKWVPVKDTSDPEHNEIRISDARAQICKVDPDSLKVLKQKDNSKNVDMGDKNKFFHYFRFECVPRDLMHFR